jgi:hypothetical protein
MDTEIPAETQADNPSLSAEKNEDSSVTKKRSTLSKLFRFQGIKSLEKEAMDAPSESSLKSSTLTRLFGKKGKGEPAESESTSSRSLFSRPFNLPFLKRKPSQLNIHSVKDANLETIQLECNNDEGSQVHEIAPSIEEIF